MTLKLVPMQKDLVQSVYKTVLVDYDISIFSPTPLVVTDEQTEETAAQHQVRMSASSATRELDELMASLSDFKVQSNVSTSQWEQVVCWYFLTI